MPAPAPTELLGTLIAGKYRLEELVARGGMGAIYRAIQEPLGRKVAVKILVAGDGGLDVRGIDRERFFREASIASRLSHPNTVVIHDYGALESRPGYYLVMEYLDGKTLADAISEGPMDLRRVIDIATQVCGALSEAHASDVVHRDLKPQNIMLVERADKRDYVKVVDFGLVKMVHPGQRSGEETAEGIIIGSPVYMAPEQIYAEAVDQRTDIYSLGIVLYEALCGRPPFVKRSSGGLQAIIMGHTSLAPPPFRVACPDANIDPHIEAIVQKCLEKNPEDRITTARELAEQLLASTAVSETGRRRATGHFLNPAGAEGDTESAAPKDDAASPSGGFDETTDFVRDDLLAAATHSPSEDASTDPVSADPAIGTDSTATSPLESKAVLPLGRPLPGHSQPEPEGIRPLWVVAPLLVIVFIGILAWAPWRASPAEAPPSPAAFTSASAGPDAAPPRMEDVSSTPSPDGVQQAVAPTASVVDVRQDATTPERVNIEVECTPVAMLTDFMNRDLGETPRTLQIRRAELPVTVKCVRPGYTTAERRVTSELVGSAPSVKVSLVLAVESSANSPTDEYAQPDTAPASQKRKKKKRRSGGSPGIKMTR